MDFWEYRTLTIENRAAQDGSFDVDWIDTVLNALGREGWELVIALPSNSARASQEVVMVFKRKRASV
jgi:hypothetical protein